MQRPIIYLALMCAVFNCNVALAQTAKELEVLDKVFQYKEPSNAYLNKFTDLAITKEKEGDLAKAEEYWLLAVEEAEKTGKYLEPMCGTLWRLALIYDKEGKYPESVATFKRLDRAIEPLFGPRSEKLIPIYAAYANVLRKMGNEKAAAIAESERAALIKERELAASGKGDWMAIAQKAVECLRANQPSEAERYAQAAYEAAKQTSDPEAQSMTLMTLGGLQKANGHIMECIKTFNTLLEMLSRTPDHSKFDEAAAYLMLGEVQIDQQDFVTATKTLDSASKVIAEYTSKNSLQEANRQQLIMQYYALKAKIARADGNVVEAQKFIELGREAYLKSR